MTTIYIDTNIFIHESFLRSASVKMFLKACMFLQINVVVPEIVLDEVKGNYLKILTEKATAFTKSQNELFKLTNLEKQSISIPDAVSEYENWLCELLEEHGVEVMPYPDISVKELIENSYKIRKPFKKNGDGHKDYIVWKSIKQHIDDQNSKPPNYFLTNNTNDFCMLGEDGKYLLHSDLGKQIEDVERRPDVFNSIKNIFRDRLEPLLEGLSLHDIPDLSKVEIETMTYRFIIEDLPMRTADGFENLPFSNDVTISSVCGEPAIQNISLTKVDDQVVINVNGTTEVEIDGFIDKHTYYNEGEELDLFVIDPDWNSHVMAVSAIIETEFELSIFYSVESKEIIGHEITLPQEIEDEWPYK